MRTFEELGLDQPILKAIQKLGFENPTPIQDKTIPVLLTSDQDMLATAQTGTGKTAAFGLPIIQKTEITNPEIQSLVLCPTRELCLQITKDLKSFSKFIPGLSVVAVYGGASVRDQIRELRNGAHIVVATPGRAIDLIEKKKLKIGSIRHLVLDEADEMMNMGFKEDIDTILKETPPEKQVILFSATMSKEIRRISMRYMDEPNEIAAAQVNAGASNVKHIYYTVHAKNRYEALKRIADVNPNIYGIVFCRTRQNTKDVSKNLIRDGYSSDAIHGDLSQAQRDEVMDKFRKKHIQLLIATDVAARGLDVNDLTHVINFNLPDDFESYTHRSGRTGRAGKDGVSIAIVHSREVGKLKRIENKTGITFMPDKVPSGMDICRKQLYTLIDKVEQIDVAEEQIEPLIEPIYKKLSWLTREELIKRFVSLEFSRFLDYYKHADDINITPGKKSERDNDKRKDRKKKERGLKRGDNNEGFQRLFINAGSKQNITPQRILGIVNEAMDSSKASIGKIDIFKNFSFFDFDKDHVKELLSVANNIEVNGSPVKIQVAEEQRPTPSDNGFGGGGGGRRNSRKPKPSFKKSNKKRPKRFSRK